jgi:hypothetical protein
MLRQIDFTVALPHLSLDLIVALADEFLVMTPGVQGLLDDKEMFRAPAKVAACVRRALIDLSHVPFEPADKAVGLAAQGRHGEAFGLLAFGPRGFPRSRGWNGRTLT